MGQQQLLLIVLGVILVGIAVIVGINLFVSHTKHTNIEGLTSDVVNLGSMAQQYYKKPLATGGGGNSFIGWTIVSGLDTTGYGSYAITSINAGTVVITGTGTEIGSNGNKVEVEAVVTMNNISTSVTNP
ncbi:MAG: hypothetical protein C0425_06150 [Chlorobiaceae bacterium]|nr:hypothetical protein [Chlorobiaceae bacterium]